MSNPMIERMAAIVWDNLDGVTHTDTPWDHPAMRRYGGTGDARENVLKIAHAVLTAMREPTEGMVEAGVVAMHQSAAYDDAVVAAHHAMIDAALAEEG